MPTKIAKTLKADVAAIKDQNKATDKKLDNIKTLKSDMKTIKDQHKATDKSPFFFVLILDGRNVGFEGLDIVQLLISGLVLILEGLHVLI